MKCHACGHDNADRALFCAACRRPLVAPTKSPTRLEPLAQPRATSANPAMAAPLGGTVGEERNRFAPPEDGNYAHAGEDANVLTDQDTWGAIIGNSNTQYYLTRFERLSDGDSAAWHWPGALLTWYWLLYRKMWLGALIYFFVPGIVFGILSALMPKAAGLLVPLWWIGMIVVPGMKANGWYYRHCMKKIADVEARGGSKAQVIARLESVGGTSGIAIVILGIFGFIAVIGILAAISVPAYQTYTVKAKVSEAVLVGADVAQAVGRQYEQTGALPGGADIDRMTAQAVHHSKYVRAVEIDGTSGVLTVRVDAGPSATGSVLMVPSADGNRHLSWTCTTEDLQRYVPASCRGQGAAR